MIFGNEPNIELFGFNLGFWVLIVPPMALLEAQDVVLDFFREIVSFNSVMQESSGPN